MPELISVNARPELPQDSKAFKKLTSFSALVSKIGEHQMSDEVRSKLNVHVSAVNDFEGDERGLKKTVRKHQRLLLNVLVKESKLVPKNYYRNMWTGLGMAAFGIPFGIALSSSLGNMSFIGLGIPIGLAVGVGLGTFMDSKAEKEGRQLDVSIEY